jgi:hypothetical protein
MIVSARIFVLLLLVRASVSIAKSCRSPSITSVTSLTLVSQDAPTLAMALVSSKRGPAGTYLGHARADDPGKRLFTLTLDANGTATWSTLYIGKGRTVQSAHWQQTGPELTLSFDPLGPHPPPRSIMFHCYHHELRPVHWDQSEWGHEGPPTLHRARDRTSDVNP